MKKKFHVELFYEMEYPEIEAENEEEAFQQALKHWVECLPNVIIRPAEEEEDGEDITCDNCPYYYKNEDEDTPRCHCESSDGNAPCEIDDYFEEEEEEYPELIFDPEEEEEDD